MKHPVESHGSGRFDSREDCRSSEHTVRELWRLFPRRHSPAFGPIQSLVLRRRATEASLNPSQPDATDGVAVLPAGRIAFLRGLIQPERIVSKLCTQQHA